MGSKGMHMVCQLVNGQCLPDFGHFLPFMRQYIPHQTRWHDLCFTFVCLRGQIWRVFKPICPKSARNGPTIHKQNASYGIVRVLQIGDMMPFRHASLCQCIEISKYQAFSGGGSKKIAYAKCVPNHVYICSLFFFFLRYIDPNQF